MFHYLKCKLFPFILQPAPTSRGSVKLSPKQEAEEVGWAFHMLVLEYMVLVYAHGIHVGLFP